MSLTRVAPIALPIPIEVVPSSTRPSQWRSQLCMIAGDCFTLILLSLIIVTTRHLITATYALRTELQFVPLIASTLAVFGLSGLYPAFLLHPAEEMKRIFTGISFVLLLLAVSTFLWRTSQDYSRAVFLALWTLSAPALFLTRRILRAVVRDQSWWGAPAVILGSGKSAQRVARQLQNNRLGLKVIGTLSALHEEEWPTDLPPLLGAPSLAPALAETGAAQYAVVAMTGYTSSELSRFVQEHCRSFSHVLLVPDLPGLCSLGVLARDLGGEIALEMPQRLFHRGSAQTKRLIDLFLSLSVLVASSPLFLLAALAIKVTSRGPILFSQTRYGKNGSTFKALKFRTMVVDSERTLASYLDRNPEARTEWRRDQKLKSDPRITAVGRYLRRLSIDELPQLLNVLAGHMSLVGPRPIVSSEIEKYGSGYSLYCRVLPGISGLWQVSGRNNTTYQQRVSFDQFYVNNWSVWLDAYILFRTIKVVLNAEGAY